MIAALQHRHNAPGAGRRSLHDLMGEPGIIGLVPIQTAYFIITMRIEAGREQNQFRLKLSQPGQPLLAHRAAHFQAAATRFQQRIHNIVVLSRNFRFGKRIKIRLAAVEQQHTRVAFENFFRTVGVVHIKINHRHPLHTILRNRMHRAHRHIVNQAKAACPVAFRMVPGRAHGTKSIVGLALHHPVHRLNHRAGTASRRR